MSNKPDIEVLDAEEIEANLPDSEDYSISEDEVNVPDTDSEDADYGVEAKTIDMAMEDYAKVIGMVPIYYKKGWVDEIDIDDMSNLIYSVRKEIDVVMEYHVEIINGIELLKKLTKSQSAIDELSAKEAVARSMVDSIRDDLISLYIRLREFRQKHDIKYSDYASHSSSPSDDERYSEEEDDS